jgi:hypothetical protein
MRTYEDFLNAVENSERKKERVFFERTCPHPSSWCKGGTIPRESRRFGVTITNGKFVDTGGEIDASPCRYYSCKKCMHPFRPKFLTVAEMESKAQKMMEESYGKSESQGDGDSKAM